MRKYQAVDRAGQCIVEINADDIYHAQFLAEMWMRVNDYPEDDFDTWLYDGRNVEIVRDKQKVEVWYMGKLFQLRNVDTGEALITLDVREPNFQEVILQFVRSLNLEVTGAAKANFPWLDEA